ncbi:DMT family transporter [Marinobacter alexandrii]|jgi:drug/metabolite transporter (DMT)-like permease|uniref:DMT family transporter n=1 Tax=Marinobacter alexandrii TaxID=2570351 RepID=UPI001109FAA8|nr:DMT family transporter [Marinobacter alexandrii]
MTALIAHRPLSPKAIVWGLLLANGFLIALMLALAKTATAQGVPAITYAFWQTLIAGLVLLLCTARPSAIFKRRLTRYFLISGLTGIAIPNAIAFYLVTKLGAGFTGIMYALPPIFTFLIATTMGLESRNWTKLTGLAIAVSACAWIVLQRHTEMHHPNGLWFALGLLIPVSLSIGNVYRSVAWPTDTKPMTLAAGTLLASAMTLGALAVALRTPLVSTAYGTPFLTIIIPQGLLTALTYYCAFELQKRSNPVFYSQLGAVAAMFGLVIGVVWFDERYAMAIWLGALTVIAGLRMSNRERRPESSRNRVTSVKLRNS